MNNYGSRERNTSTMPPRQRPAPLHEVREVELPPVDASDPDRRSAGVRDIVSGAVLIGIGLVLGGSVLTGDPSALDWLFDILGLFWIGKGVYQLVT
jgi:hypothetical protein